MGRCVSAFVLIVPTLPGLVLDTGGVVPDTGGLLLDSGRVVATELGLSVESGGGVVEEAASPLEDEVELALSVSVKTISGEYG